MTFIPSHLKEWQSLPLCIACALLGGALEVAATAILCHARMMEKLKHDPYYLSSTATSSSDASVSVMSSASTYNSSSNNNNTRVRFWRRKLNFFFYAILQIFAAVFMNTFAPWFGPVSYIPPMMYCSQIIINVVLFVAYLGYDSLTKDMTIGTYVILVAAVLYPTVGPTTQEQEHQEDDSLLSHYYVMVWVGFLGLGLMGSLGCILYGVHKFEKKGVRMAILLTARICALTINITVSRLLLFREERLELFLLILVKISTGMTISLSIGAQNTVDQSRFVPVLACGVILVNAITGMVLWEEWRKVQSWVGYGCCFLLMILACFLLLSEIELLGADNSTYGRGRFITEPGLPWDDHRLTPPEEDGEERRNWEEGEVAELLLPGQASRSRESLIRVRTRNSILSVYGLSQDIIDKGGRRNRTIFAEG